MPGASRWVAIQALVGLASMSAKAANVSSRSGTYPGIGPSGSPNPGPSPIGVRSGRKLRIYTKALVWMARCG